MDPCYTNFMSLEKKYFTLFGSQHLMQLSLQSLLQIQTYLQLSFLTGMQVVSTQCNRQDCLFYFTVLLILIVFTTA